MFKNTVSQKRTNSVIQRSSKAQLMNTIREGLNMAYREESKVNLSPIRTKNMTPKEAQI